jgi:transglutaminase-like putative cysteine protease
MATAMSWEAKSRWFFDVNSDQFEVTPAIQEKVDEILKDQGLTRADEERKAKALLHWVAQNIRYSGQTMGEGEGFTLHTGDMIFEQRSGVCKDIAGMLVTMMRAAGMDSYAAMTMAGSRIDEVPADQFNHCVTALKLEDGTFRMYDPTWVPFNNDWRPNSTTSWARPRARLLTASVTARPASRRSRSPTKQSWTRTDPSPGPSGSKAPAPWTAVCGDSSMGPGKMN